MPSKKRKEKIEKEKEKEKKRKKKEVNFLYELAKMVARVLGRNWK